MYTLCHINDIPEGGSKGFQAGELNLFGIKKDASVVLYINSCPHLGVPLEWMPDKFLDDEGCYIQCSTHGALFSIENGQCVSGPCMHEFLEKMPFRIENESIIIDL